MRRLSLFLALLIAGCGSSEEPNAAGDDSTRVAEVSADSSEAEPTKKPRERKSNVNAAKVIRGELVVPVIAEGQIRARRSAEIRSEVSGRITRLFVEEGDIVREGQKLALLDGREHRIAMEEAHSRYLNALGVISVEEEDVDHLQNKKNQLQEQLEELADLEKSGKISRDERRERELEMGIRAMKEGVFRRELVEARAGLAQARADEERAKLNLSRTTIRAPFSGVVSNMTLTTGHHLTTGETLCKLVDHVDVEADIGVLESDLGGLEVGRPALLIVPALQETLRTHVDVISPEVDPDSRTCRVLMRIRQEDGSLRPGMFVRAAIAGKIYQDKLLVPNEAILTRDGRPMLFKVEGEAAKWVYVKVGLRNDQFTEIERVLQGGPLDPGTLVVVSDHLTLSHDAKIKVRRVVDNQVAWASEEAVE